MTLGLIHWTSGWYYTCVYPLSLPETKAKEEYITEALVQGRICPWRLSAAAGFFIVEKTEADTDPV